MPNIDSPLQEPHPRHASATIVTTEREYIPPKPPTRNILPRGSPHKRTPIGQRAGVSAVSKSERLPSLQVYILNLYDSGVTSLLAQWYSTRSYCTGNLLYIALHVHQSTS